MSDGRVVRLHIIRGIGNVYQVPMVLPDMVLNGLQRYLSADLRHTSAPYWQATVNHAEERLRQALDADAVLESDSSRYPFPPADLN